MYNNTFYNKLQFLYNNTFFPTEYEVYFRVQELGMSAIRGLDNIKMYSEEETAAVFQQFKRKHPKISSKKKKVIKITILTIFIKALHTTYNILKQCLV